MNLISLIKKNLVSLPFPIGKLISYIPFKLRPGVGVVYSKRSSDILLYQEMNELKKRRFIFERVKKITIHAYENVEFYNKFYNSKNFTPKSLKRFDDLNSIPIITKADLQKYNLNERSFSFVESFTENTGGSTGKPLELLIEPSSVGHEWSHMHKVWGRIGFNPSDLRIVFSGRSSIENVIQYDSARHQINVDIYKGWQLIADKLLESFDYYKPTYLHGYPSAIFDFVLWLETKKHPLLKVFNKKIDGLMLGSEFPNPILREKVELALNCKSVSWYGHTERAVLAYETNEKGIYSPFQTYGYAEAVEINDETKLVATSYYNYAHPLIRYNTEDGIKQLGEQSILGAFEISKGRDGDFILDSGGNKIFLTGLIFGRHHKLFDYCSSIQVSQPSPGIAVILFVTRSGKLNEPEKLFDNQNVEITFSFKEITQPFKTKSGKTPLLVGKI